jgi:protein-export membrane protein SecD
MLAVARWRIILVALVTVLGALFALPTFLTEAQRASLPGFMPKAAINLGLDLQGGSYLLLQIDTPALTQRRLEKLVDDMESALAEDNIDPPIAFEIIGADTETAAIRLLDAAADGTRAMAALEDIVEPVAAGGFGATTPDVTFTLLADGVIEGRVTERALELLQRQAIGEAIEVIRRRIDPTGTSEVSITRQGEDRINVQAPGMADPELLKQRIGQTAALTFHEVDDRVTYQDIAEGRPLPRGTVVMPFANPQEGIGIALRQRPTMEGGNLTSARSGQDQENGGWVVNFRLDSEGTRIFRQFTTQNVGRQFAIVLDGQVLSAPSVREPIISGSAQISGGFTNEQVAELSLLLRAGALPAPLTVMEQRSVGPGLGQDAIDSGTKAGIVAAIGVLAFMGLAYGLFGLFGCLALVVNMVLIVAAMAMVGATLTLPGIAGLILTMAMAVDANVLIYERMREEAANGRGPAMAIEGGFGRAMITIMDANLTTILAAAILFQFGAGPVRGFAWTLSIGVITSVFTAVLVTQILVALWFRTTKPKSLPI